VNPDPPHKQIARDGRRLYHRAMRRLLVAAALLLPALPLLADPFEITAWASYRTGGVLDVSLDGGDTTLDEAGALGISLGLWTRPDSLVELHYSVQSTEVDVEDFFGEVGSVDLDVEYIQLGGCFFFLRPGNPSRIMGYIAGSLGATRFSGEGGEAQTFFSGSLGGGADVRLSEHLSLRLDGRFYTTVEGTSGAIACTPSYCVSSVSGNYFAQFVTSAGLAVKF
jgi:hypothetical protein